MSSLRRQDGRFLLDVRAATEACVGNQNVSVLLDRSALETSAPHGSTGEDAVIVGPASRAATIAGLLFAWQRGMSGLLAPSGPILTRLESAPRQKAVLLDEPRKDDSRVDLEFPEGKKVATLLTSGSTGQPQLFLKSARQVFGEAILLAELLQLDETSTVLSTTACHHVYGLLFSVLSPWAGGAQIVTDERNEPDAFHPLSIAELIADRGVTHLITVPAHLRALLQAPIELKTLRQVVCSAAALNPDDAKAFERRFRVEVLDVLGSTETGGIATRRPTSSALWRPLPGVEVFLGQEERLSIRSVFLDDPHEPYESGDRARLHGDGTFEHLGRSDGVIKVGGKRISRQEIEQIARQIPRVKDVACTSRRVNGLRGEEVLLAVESDDLDASTVKNHLRASLDPVFVPRRVRVVRELSRSDRGKVDREALLALFKGGASQPDGEHFKLASLEPDSVRFRGHFAGAPIFPALAQLTDLVLPEVRRRFGGGALLELNRVKWTEPLRPGARVKVVLARKTRGIRFEVRVADASGERTACSGTLVLAAHTPTSPGAEA